MSLGHGAGIVRDGLTSQIDFANSKIGSGNTKTNLVAGASDFVGQNSAVFANGMFQANGLNPGSFMSEGSSGTYGGGTGGLGNHGTNSFTYQFLVRPKTSISLEPQNYTRFFEQSGWPETYVIAGIEDNNGNPRYTFYGKELNENRFWGVQTPDNSVVLNEWIFITCVCDRSANLARIYLNDTLSVSGSNSSLSQITNIGNDDPIFFPSSYAEMEADYSCFLIYNRALSDAEVSQNFAALRGRFGI